jgi:hypothetical protein
MRASRNFFFAPVGKTSGITSCGRARPGWTDMPPTTLCQPLIPFRSSAVQPPAVSGSETAATSARTGVWQDKSRDVRPGRMAEKRCHFSVSAQRALWPCDVRCFHSSRGLARDGAQFGRSVAVGP